MSHPTTARRLARANKPIAVSTAAICILTLPACEKFPFGPFDPGKTCISKETLEGVKATAISNVPRADPRLGSVVRLQLSDAVLDSYDAVTKKTDCTALFTASAPSLSRDGVASRHVSYSVQNTADGHKAYTLYGDAGSEAILWFVIANQALATQSKRPSQPASQPAETQPTRTTEQRSADYLKQIAEIAQQRSNDGWPSTPDPNALLLFVQNPTLSTLETLFGQVDQQADAPNEPPMSFWFMPGYTVRATILNDKPRSLFITPRPPRSSSVTLNIPGTSRSIALGNGRLSDVGLPTKLVTTPSSDDGREAQAQAIYIIDVGTEPIQVTLTLSGPNVPDEALTLSSPQQIEPIWPTLRLATVTSAGLTVVNN